MAKEAVALANRGFIVTVIYANISDWADEFDKTFIKEHSNIKWVAVCKSKRANPTLFKLFRVRRKFWELIFKNFGDKFNAALKSLVLYSQELEKVALKHKADLFIGHNLGSIKSVVKGGKKFKSKIAFDFEDFHRGESQMDTLQHDLVKIVEDKFVPQLNYATAASPLISQAYKALYPSLPLITINNCFYKSCGFDEVMNLRADRIKLFWFSQYVADGRGIDAVIKAMGLVGGDDFELTLLGNCSKASKNHFLSLAKEFGVNEDQIIFLNPVLESEIVKIAAQHHVGLALEPGRDLNNHIALSNKIFIYLISGNAIIYSKIRGQLRFFEQNKNIGCGFDIGDYVALSEILIEYKRNKALLENHRNNALIASETWNWERESEKIIDLVNSQLN